jgi:hypothetical protein
MSANYTAEEKALLDQAAALAKDPAAHEGTAKETIRRLRTAKDKYTDLYRRQGARSVEEAGGRGAAAGDNQRTKEKAEAFGEALAAAEAAVGD